MAPAWPSTFPPLPRRTLLTCIISQARLCSLRVFSCSYWFQPHLTGYQFNGFITDGSDLYLGHAQLLLHRWIRPEKSTPHFTGWTYSSSWLCGNLPCYKFNKKEIYKTVNKKEMYKTVNKKEIYKTVNLLLTRQCRLLHSSEQCFWLQVKLIYILCVQILLKIFF